MKQYLYHAVCDNDFVFKKCFTFSFKYYAFYEKLNVLSYGKLKVTKCTTNLENFATSNSNFIQFTNSFTDGKYVNQKLNSLKKNKLYKMNDTRIISEKVFEPVTSFISSKLSFT